MIKFLGDARGWERDCREGWKRIVSHFDAYVFLISSWLNKRSLYSLNNKSIRQWYHLRVDFLIKITASALIVITKALNIYAHHWTNCSKRRQPWKVDQYWQKPRNYSVHVYTVRCTHTEREWLKSSYCEYASVSLLLIFADARRLLCLTTLSWMCMQVNDVVIVSNLMTI